MTIQELTNKGLIDKDHWLNHPDVKTEDEDVELDDKGGIIWKSGTWKDGTWEGGTWEGGFWGRGTWKKGVWKGGFWGDGIWEDGTWKRGRMWNNIKQNYVEVGKWNEDTKKFIEK